VPHMCPGYLPSGEFLPAEDDKNNAHPETADQEAEISVLSQRLEHAIRLTQRGMTSQRWCTRWRGAAQLPGRCKQRPSCA